jgi:hypothetical protein
MNVLNFLDGVAGATNEIFRLVGSPMQQEAREARAAVAELIERERVMREALTEIIAINDEPDGTFRKRGGTRRGLSIVTARAALARVQGEA